MGSYSCEDHLLPFLSQEHIDQASRTNAAVATALAQKTGEGFKGIIYGSFMLTKDGLRVIEYNARFGDPEIMNCLPLLEADFVDVCRGIITGNLDPARVKFRRKATVCKYVVPKGYPTDAVAGAEISLVNMPASSETLRVYYASVNERGGHTQLTGSRAIAFVGIGDTLAEAERIAEDAANSVRGPVFHRTDIGTAELIARRVDHMAGLQSGAVPRRPITHSLLISAKRHPSNSKFEVPDFFCIASGLGGLRTGRELRAVQGGRRSAWVMDRSRWVQSWNTT